MWCRVHCRSILFGASSMHSEQVDISTQADCPSRSTGCKNNHQMGRSGGNYVTRLNVACLHNFAEENMYFFGHMKQIPISSDMDPKRCLYDPGWEPMFLWSSCLSHCPSVSGLLWVLNNSMPHCRVSKCQQLAEPPGAESFHNQVTGVVYITPLVAVWGWVIDGLGGR